MWRMRRWVNVSPRKDTRCALRELTRESRVSTMKHGTSANASEKDGQDKERWIDRQSRREKPTEIDRKKEKEQKRRKEKDTAVNFPRLLFRSCSSDGKKGKPSRSREDTRHDSLDFTFSVFSPRRHNGMKSIAACDKRCLNCKKSMSCNYNYYINQQVILDNQLLQM